MGFSREQVASALHCTPMLIAAMENGTADPGPEMLAKLGKLYRRPVEWFSGESHYEPTPEVLRMLENCPEPDRAVLAEFAEWLAGAGPAPKNRETR